jgi:hypothetical protein
MRLARLSVFAIVLAGCGNGAGGDAATPGVPEQTQATRAIPSQPETLLPTPNATSPTATPVKQTGTVIKSAKSQFGMMLFDGTGQAIYLFDKEQTTAPAPRHGHRYSPKARQPQQVGRNRISSAPPSEPTAQPR